MPTTNVTITNTYTQIAADTDTSLLVTFDSDAMVEFATTTTAAAPTVRGHRLSKQDGISRAIIGPGYVWARTVPGLRPGSAQLVVTK